MCGRKEKMDITDLTVDQSDALYHIHNWIKNKDRQLITLGGAAGCGKTTIIRYLKEQLSQNLNVAFCAFTGKAASVLSTKLKTGNCLRSSDYCGTVHSLIYFPVIDKVTGEIIDWEKKEKLDYDLIILDEASMINEYLFEDLQSYNIPILAVGDCFQLPPIEGKLNLMLSPDIKLTKIHRQSENNPIIQVSLLARNEGFIPYKKFSDNVVKITKREFSIINFVDNYDFNKSIILCGFNNTRVSINKAVREILKFKSYTPEPKDRVICLKNNTKAKDCPIFNGLTGTVEKCISKSSGYRMEISVDNEIKHYKGMVSDTTFNNEKGVIAEDYRNYLDYWDYSYSISVHKAQGSEFDNVALFEQHCDYWTGDNWKRWLYTAVTRAKNKLIIIGQR
jgi:exodeoxyribonuclease-5